jgi:hypothetical protein
MFSVVMMLMSGLVEGGSGPRVGVVSECSAICIWLSFPLDPSLSSRYCGSSGLVHREKNGGSGEWIGVVLTRFLVGHVGEGL